MAQLARRGWQLVRQRLSLSGLGWALVAAAMFWLVFAFVFSQRAGWGWDKGAFFFVWGLGVLALGFCLRSRVHRPGFSRLFLGVNVLVLGVLSLMVAMP
jgi:hypothetical protein